MSESAFNRGIKDADRAKNRKDCEKRIKRARDRVAMPDYILDQKGVAHAVHCKCGTVIKSLVPHERLTFNRMPLAVMAETPLYVEVELIMDDGSTHVTPMCKPCAEGLDSDKAEAVYAVDIDRLAKQEPTLVENTQWARRKPIGHRRVR
jgi:hypothetical protein